ncbi:MAG: hypothetical protein RL653_1526, partial [Pseudomonadota bacterium]
GQRGERGHRERRRGAPLDARETLDGGSGKRGHWVVDIEKGRL